MAKVTITGLKIRTKATDKKAATPLHKSKPAPAKAYMKPPTVAQDKTYNSKIM
jgi:hypothetical protein